MIPITIKKRASDFPNNLAGILTKFIEVVHELLGKFRYSIIACGFTSPFLPPFLKAGSAYPAFLFVPIS